MKKQLMALLTGAVLSTSALHSQADSYFGVSAGVTDVDTGITNLTGSATLDESDSGFKLFYGFNVKPQFAVEYHFADFGEATLKGDNNDTFDFRGSTVTVQVNDYTVNIDGKSFGAAGVFKFVESGTFVHYAKLGIHRWTADITGSVPIGSATISASASDDGFDVFYGLGADINVSDSFAVRVEYELYDFDVTDLTLVSVGAVFKF